MTITERRASLAARQLLYHKRLIPWIERKIEENEEVLVTYLISNGKEQDVLIGGFEIELDGEEIQVRHKLGRIYEQLEIPEVA